MIQANELRIGNWIEDRMGRAYQILGILSMYRILFGPGSDKERQIDEILGIKLTPEILEKAGFEYISFGLWKIDFHQKDDWFRLEYFEDDSTYPDRGTLLLGGQRIFNHPQYVHQLQNLYFALTGEEFPIEL